MHKTMRVYGVDRRWDHRVKCHWTHSTLAIAGVCVCVCVRTASLPHGVVSLNTSRVSWRFAVHCPHSVLPHPALSRVHALSACDGNVGSPLNSREEINKGEHLQTEVSFTSANLKIDDDGPHFSGSKKQVALRDSLHLSKIWRMEWHGSWLPGSSFVLVWGRSFTNVSSRTVPKVVTWFWVLYCIKSWRNKDSG